MIRFLRCKEKPNNTTVYVNIDRIDIIRPFQDESDEAGWQVWTKDGCYYFCELQDKNIYKVLDGKDDN